ncbi:hypothetical protein D3C75_622640 [compost metagenome]
MRQGYFFPHGAQAFVNLEGSEHRFFHSRVYARTQVFLGHRDAQALYISGQCGHIIGNLHVQGGGVLAVMPGNRLEYIGGVLHIFGQGTDLVQRRSKSHQAVTGNQAVGGLQAHNAAIGGGLPDGAACIRTQGEIDLACGNCRCRTAAGAAWHIGRIPRVIGGMETGVFVGAPHGELVHVGFAHQYSLGAPQLGHRGCVIDGLVVGQKFAGTGGQGAHRRHIVLNSCGQTEQQPPFAPVLQLLVQESSLGFGILFIKMKEGGNLRLHIGNPPVRSIHQIGDGQFAACQLVMHILQSQIK